jgi:hypothetical protein
MDAALREVLMAPARPVVGLFAACLPRRKWNDWDEAFGVHRMVLPAALLTVLVGFAIGIPGFVRYAAEAGSRAGDLILETSYQVMAGKAPSTAPASAWYTMMFTLPTYILFTPGGLFSAYLVTSGVFRCLRSVAGDPGGDPLLTVGDWIVRRRVATARSRRAAESREAQEGPEVPDALVPGRAVGRPEAVYAVIASRRKADWLPGVFVLTPDGRYRVGEPFDRRLAGGLRAIYPLIEVPAVEATRRRVAYTLPPLVDLDPVTRALRPANDATEPQSTQRRD